MTRVGIAGHRGLPADTESLVEAAMRELLAGVGGDLVGVTSLADGADQMFARMVLDMSGALQVIVPAAEYRAGLPQPSLPAYDSLIASASDVVHLPYTESTPESHMAAAEAMLQRIDRLVAVWDGQPARGFGGTADVVRKARTNGLHVDVVWPEGAYRD
jgi:hypothetical protein